MEEKNYYRASLGMKDAITGVVAADYHSDLIRRFREHGNALAVPQADVEFHLAKEFGFCYGVDKAVDMAYEARTKFPDRRIFLLTEIIHNPRVNRRLVDMGIVFLSGQYRHPELTVADIRAEDVVLIPAFGTAAEEFQRLRKLGAIIVDTTCGSVVHVWKRVERYAKDGFSSIVHGKYWHEETIATVSMARAQGGHWLVVRDRAQTQSVCDYIEGRRDTSDLLGLFDPRAYSAGFEPERDLRRVGVANQTTMLASESLEFAAMIGDAIARRDGAASRQEATAFRSFDTICSATQDRQDAIRDLIGEHALDLVLVIGGYNSSNTSHLLDVARRRCPAWHIEDSSCLVDADSIVHLEFGAKSPITSRGWLPAGPLRIGLTAGASTPNRAIADTVARIVELRGVDPAAALAAT